MNNFPNIVKIQSEIHQSQLTRQRLFKEIEEEIKMPLLTYFIPFDGQKLIDEQDAVLIEDVVRNLNPTNGFALLIDGPGGYPKSAERIVRRLNQYSGTGCFNAIVCNKAKSAATMIAMGAKEIWMSNTSELGPIDPQIQLKGVGQIAAQNYIKAYDELLETIEETPIEMQTKFAALLEKFKPYNYDLYTVLKQQIEFGEELAKELLSNGSCSHLEGEAKTASVDTIVNALSRTESTLDHGRAVYAEQAIDLGMNVKTMDLNDKTWSKIYELWMRTHTFVNANGVKCVESSNLSATH